MTRDRRDLLKRAFEWLRQLETGEVASRAAIARREGLSRARVTQILNRLGAAMAPRERVGQTRKVEKTGCHVARRLFAQSVVLEPDHERGYFDVLAAFPGCYSQRETAEEALANVHEALLQTIEGLRERGAIPARLGELVHRVAFLSERNVPTRAYRVARSRPSADEIVRERGRHSRLKLSTNTLPLPISRK